MCMIFMIYDLEYLMIIIIIKKKYKKKKEKNIMIKVDDTFFLHRKLAVYNILNSFCILECAVTLYCNSTNK